ncbi:MAG: T9SS type A sorting domain-containing protein [Chloroflexota bacterium]
MKKLTSFIFTALCVLELGASPHLISAALSDSAFRNDFERTEGFYKRLRKSAHGGREARNKQLDRWLYLNRLESDSPNKIPRIKESKDGLLSEQGWLPLGPETVPPSYEEKSAHGIGRVNCIAFHPTDKNIFWIGTPGGGIWKTVNGGKSWIPQCDNAATPEISDIVADKNNPDILYAATGDFDGRGLFSARALGVMKSTDGGSTWSVNEKLINAIEYHNLKRVIINGTNSNCLLTCGPGGAWKSTDGGETWRGVSNLYLTDLEVDPRSPDVVYAASSAHYYYPIGRPGVYKSTNFGDSWFALPASVDTLATRVEIAISPVDPDYIYAIAVSGFYPDPARSEGLKAIYLSTNAGESWKEQANCFNSDNVLGGYNGDESDGGGQGRYDLVLLTDPQDKHKIYVGGVNIWCSTDGGRSFDLASFWIKCFGASVHADQHAAAFNPLDNKFYWCNDGGVFRTEELLCGSKYWIKDWLDRSTNELKPGHPDLKFPTVWENLSDGLMITEFYKLSLCKNYKDIVSGGAQDNSCYYRRGDEGWLNYVPNRDGMETAIDYNDPGIVYGVSQYGGLCKSTDGCKTVRTGLTNYIWRDAQEWGDWVTPLAMDPVNSNNLYMGFRNLWNSTDGGETWKQLTYYGAYGIDNFSSITALKIAHSNPAYISYYKKSSQYYDGYDEQVKEIPAELRISTNGGAQWTLSNLLKCELVTSIEYDRANPKKMWFTAKPDSGSPDLSVAYSADAGVNWNWLVRENVPAGISAIVCRGDSKNTLYIGARSGVYYTNDEMTEWKALNDNLPNATVSDLEIDFNSKRLYASTYGRGIWYKSLEGTGVTEEKPIPIPVYPNPSRGDFYLDLSMLGSSLPVAVKILDVTGRKVYSGAFTSGVPALIPSNLPVGVYFIVADIDGKMYNAKIEIEK